MSYYSGGPLGSHPFSSLFLCWVGVPLLSDILLAVAPFTFCGSLAVAPSMGGACLAYLGILVPDTLVLGILQGIILVLSLFSRVASPCAGEEGGVALLLSRLSRTSSAM